MSDLLPTAHHIKISARTSLSAGGVQDVSAFDETVVIAQTTDGEMTVEGEGLHITSFSTGTGELLLEGRICAVYYDDKPQKKKGAQRRRG